jgi:hypothetical protein
LIALLQFWLGLCLLRNEPRQLPASPWLLGLSILCYLAGSLLVTALSYGPSLGAQMVLLELLLLVGFVAGLLYLTGKPARIIQTLSALTGAGALLSFPALLLAVIETGAEVQQLSLLWLALLVWNLLVTAHIMRHALAVSMLVGVAVAMFYIVVSTRVFVTVFPQLTAQ